VEKKIDTTQPCSCGGNNERCYKCDGTGYVQTPAGHGSGSIFSLPPAAQPVPWQGWKYGPPKAKRKVRGTPKSAKPSARVSTMSTRVVITLPAVRETPQQLIRDGIKFTSCSYCNFQVPTKRFQAHEDNCARLWKKKNARKRSGAPLTPPPASLSRPAGTAVQSDAMITCTICQCRLNAKNLERHLRRAHVPEPARTKVPRTIRPRTVPVTSETAAPERTHYDSQDASKYMGHFVRDHGRFGSMPSYDDFSDEGSPD
jgi:hypothetical protein